PAPILCLADSGEGKTFLAEKAAEWLTGVQPWWLRQERRDIDGVPWRRLACSDLTGRNQGAQTNLFGRGLQTPGRESPDAGGLVTLGIAQQSSGGILILDELGNADPSFQQMLLNFVEKGETQPEFRTHR